ncbi:MAG TPA: hypothetical protein VMT76_04340 [Puia sp.]|nr:hypothetical protein [Puia sp.]
MKFSLSFSFLIAFFSLVFLCQELHDWSHVFVGTWLCGCFGSKGFDSWTLCDHCEVSGNILALVWFAGPAVTVLLAWIARAMMNKRNSGAIRSAGFSLLFAANPFVNIIKVVSGDGDIPYGMKLIFQPQKGSNGDVISIIALLIVFIFTIPPLFRAIKMVKTKIEKWIIIPAFLILPNLIKTLVVTIGLNFLLKRDVFQEDIFSGTPLLVLIWLFIIIVLLMINYKSLLNFIRKKENKAFLRI